MTGDTPTRESFCETAPEPPGIPAAPTPDARGNRLLAGLSRRTWLRLRPRLEVVPVRAGEVLQRPGEPMQHAWFPIDCVVSLRQVMQQGGAATEIVPVGAEGMIGITLLTGDDAGPCGAYTHVAGHASRIECQHVRAAFAGAADFRKGMLRYTQALLAQIAQTAACFRHHDIDQQLSRALLLNDDRAHPARVDITAETICRLLGLCSEEAAACVEKLQRRGLIACDRGSIVVADRAGLERHCCECYRTMKGVIDRLIPWKPKTARPSPGACWHPQAQLRT